MAKAPGPTHLSLRSRRLFATIAADYGLDSEPHAIELLRLALGALDRADEARRILDREGIVLVNAKGEKRPHPAVQIERDSRTAVAALLRELSLDSGVVEAPRLPRIGTGALA